jgi:hypothetical protein
MTAKAAQRTGQNRFQSGIQRHERIRATVSRRFARSSLGFPHSEKKGRRQRNTCRRCGKATDRGVVDYQSGMIEIDHRNGINTNTGMP